MARRRWRSGSWSSPCWRSSAASSRRSAATEELGTFLPAAGGRLSYPIGYWNGLAAAMAIGLVLLVWLGGHARAAGVRAVAVAAIPLPILVIYLASSRGGVAAGVVGLAVLLALGPARARMFAGL